MKLAWLVRRDEGDDWRIVFEEPSRYLYESIKPIVWEELKEGGAPE